MSKELKNTQVYYGEDVLMMRVDDCLIFGNKDALRKLAKKLEEWTKVVEHNVNITGTDGYKYHEFEYLCGACKKKVLSGDEYCSHCGAKLDWSNDD